MPKHNAIYVRVSTEDQTTASQLPDLTKWAEAAGGPAQWYHDKFTGRKLDRPGMTELLADVKAGRVAQIVVWRLDRLGRTCKGLCALFEDLTAAGVGLVSLRDGFDLSSPAGKLHAQILAAVAEYETEVRADRVRSGIEAIREKSDAARSMAKRGLGAEVIAVHIGLRVETVRKILEKPTGCYWGGGKRGVMYKPNASHERVRELLARGLKPPEIAKLLDVSLRTVRARMSDLGGAAAIRASAPDSSPELAQSASPADVQPAALPGFDCSP